MSLRDKLTELSKPIFADKEIEGIGPVKIKVLKAEEIFLAQSMIDPKAKSFNPVSNGAPYIIYGLHDQDGNRVYEPEDAAEVMSLPVDLFSNLAMTVLRVNKLTADDEEDAQKK